MSYDQAAVRAVLDQVQAEGRTALTALEGKRVCEAYGISTPPEGFATSAGEAVRLAEEIGYPVVLKIASPDILHKTDAGGVLPSLQDATEVEQGYATILVNATTYKADANVTGVQVQRMLPAGQEVIVGTITDPSFGKLVAFGLGGILVEVLQDITFRLAPATRQDAMAMLDDIAGAAVLHGVRGAAGVDREALSALIENVSHLVSDFPPINEMDLNPVLATSDGATAVDGKHPSWYVNLQRDPNATVQIEKRVIPVTAITATQEQKKRLWPEFTAIYPDYDNYEKETERDIPVVLLHIADVTAA